jgi:hypothetical protein
MIQLIPNRAEIGTMFPNVVFQALLDSPRVGLNHHD